MIRPANKLKSAAAKFASMVVAEYSSKTEPGTKHLVCRTDMPGGLMCSCMGFRTHGHCWHICAAALKSGETLLYIGPTKTLEVKVIKQISSNSWHVRSSKGGYAFAATDRLESRVKQDYPPLAGREGSK